MDGKKIYSIQINGVQDNINAITALNKQLSELESRIKALESRSLKISTSSSSSSSGRSSKSALAEEEKLAKKIEQIDAKRETYGKRIYQNYLAAKDVLKETVEDQKQLAAQERLQANNYTNTMKGMKDKLADIKNIMQTTDIGSDLFKKYTQEANALTQKLKELEEAYGQFGRNVGNYKSAADGFKQLEITVNGVVRTFSNAREAYRTLKNERDTMALSGQRETKQFKELDETVKTLASDIKDMSKSSTAMDNILDTMDSFTAMAGIGVGLTQLFGIDDTVFSDSMQKLASLLLILKSFETLAEQWQSEEGLFTKMFKPMSEAFDKWADKAGTNSASKFFDKFSAQVRKEFAEWANDESGNVPNPIDEIFTIRANKGMSNDDINGSGLDLFKYWDTLDEKQKETFYLNHRLVDEAINNAGKLRKRYELISSVVKGLGKAFITVGGIIASLVVAEALEMFTKFVKTLNSAKVIADRAEQSMNKLNREFQVQKEILSSDYLKGAITDEEYLNALYKKQSEVLAEQISLLKDRSKEMEDRGVFGTGFFTQTRGTEFNGQRFNENEGAEVSSGYIFRLDLVAKSVEEVEEKWKQCNEAIKEGKDIASKFGEGVVDWLGSWVITLNDTEEAMRGLGNIKLSDFIGQFGELNQRLKDNKISAEDYAKELAKLRKAMNDNEILSTVIANLDKYIPDDKVRETVQNIINEIYRLDDAFNMTSPEQIHHWEQVRIDGMKEGWAKTKAQIKENQRWELLQDGYTEEQRELIRKKYRRQELEAREKYNKEAADKAKEANKKLTDADNQLTALRIANMKEGFDKRMAELDNQKRLELQKLASDAKDNKYIKVQEMTVEIEKKYDKLKLDEKRKWAFDTLKVYEDLAARISQLNEATMQTEASTATERVETRQRKAEQSAASTFITPTTYDDSKELEKYYAKVVEIKKEAAERELQIERERLAKEADYQREEENLRHSRLINADGGEYIQQLRAGLITQEQYDKLIEDENNAHYARMNAIDKQYESNLSATTQDTLEETQKLYSDYYGNIINNLKNDKSKVDEIMSKQPITDTKGWDIVNIGKTSAAYNKALVEYDKLRQEILKKQAKLRDDLEKGNISAEAFGLRQKEIDAELKSLDEAAKGVKERQKMLFADFMQSLSPYIQAVGQAANQVLSSLSEISSNNYQAQIDEQQKYIEKYEELLDKQKEATQKYVDEVNSIEDELKTARGDRRQQLIDNLNAQMAAERASLAQEKKIEKEKQKAEDKKKKLEHDQAVAKKKMDLAQAYINAAMAVSMAAVNKWPVPAIPMMALAAAAGAAQIAAVASQNIPSYGDGGVIQGKSHAQGGVKVLGGRAEVEGGEFITNKVTTEKNVELLDFVNSKRKKLNLSDFIEFYGGGSVKKNIEKVKTKFADGGIIPTLRSDIAINDRLLQSFEDYSNRPVTVSVVEINDKQEAVRNVQVLSGLES